MKNVGCLKNQKEEKRKRKRLNPASAEKNRKRIGSMKKEVCGEDAEAREALEYRNDGITKIIQVRSRVWPSRTRKQEGKRKVSVYIYLRDVRKMVKVKNEIVS